MNSDQIAQKLNSILEDLASIEHARWSHWQRYMHSKGKRLKDGSLILPAELVSLWEHQIETPYAELSEKEKESDREQVRKYLPVVLGVLDDGSADSGPD